MADTQVGGVVAIVRAEGSVMQTGGVVAIARARIGGATIQAGGIVVIARGWMEDQMVRSAIGAHLGIRYPQAIAGGAADGSDGDRAAGVLSGSLGAQLSKPVAIGIEQWQ